MDKKEADALVQRSMEVILSCKTMSQLDTAVRYSNLVYKKLAYTIGLINNMKFVTLMERSIGFAQCQIKCNGGKP